jgi:hypothetical protein
MSPQSCGENIFTRDLWFIELIAADNHCVLSKPDNTANASLFPSFLSSYPSTDRDHPPSYPCFKRFKGDLLSFEVPPFSLGPFLTVSSKRDVNELVFNFPPHQAHARVSRVSRTRKYLREATPRIICAKHRPVWSQSGQITSRYYLISLLALNDLKRNLIRLSRVLHSAHHRPPRRVPDPCATESRARLQLSTTRYKSGPRGRLGHPIKTSGPNLPCVFPSMTNMVTNITTPCYKHEVIGQDAIHCGRVVLLEGRLILCVERRYDAFVVIHKRTR